jgi:dihydrodipicolinate synthase/N-acetylneuraminate lyase
VIDRLEHIDRRRRPRRKVKGISAALLPYRADGHIDESGFRCHLQRTLNAGLEVAVNMDTGYADLLSAEEKLQVLRWTSGATKHFVAGAAPHESNESAAVAYARECAAIREMGGTPIIFPSGYTTALDDEGLIQLFTEIARVSGEFLAFELGPMFSPHGRMFSEGVLRALMELPQCCGLKHSSLDRTAELARLQLRDQAQPGFTIYSGNDLAADMIEYGSDYLLGLSTFAPELFRARDLAWQEGKSEYFELRDAIQYLGWVGFREPVPAYKHSAAIFLKLTHSLESDEPHPRAARREMWDRAALADAACRLARICPELIRDKR